MQTIVHKSKYNCMKTCDKDMPYELSTSHGMYFYATIVKIHGKCSEKHTDFDFRSTWIENEIGELLEEE